MLLCCCSQPDLAHSTTLHLAQHDSQQTCTLPGPCPPRQLHTCPVPKPLAPVCVCLCRYGEIESRWVAMESWTFSTSISAQEVGSLLEQQQVLLQLDGVDTYADVLINDVEVAKTTNFHRCGPIGAQRSTACRQAPSWQPDQTDAVSVSAPACGTRSGRGAAATVAVVAAASHRCSRQALLPFANLLLRLLPSSLTHAGSGLCQSSHT